MWFASFPIIQYSNKFNPIPTQMVDITRRIKLREAISETLWLFDTYIIKDEDRPDTIADKYYQDSNLHWLILISNDKLSLSDWPLSQRQLEEAVEIKYGDKKYDVHHYVNSAGEITSNAYFGTSLDFNGEIYFPGPTADMLPIPVTNYEYEVEVNDAKRPIKLIRPELVGEIVRQFTEEISK